MDNIIKVEISLITGYGVKPKYVTVDVMASEWEQVQGLPYDLRMDYIFRIAEAELLRAQVRRVGVRLISPPTGIPTP